MHAMVAATHTDLGTVPPGDVAILPGNVIEDFYHTAEAGAEYRLTGHVHPFFVKDGPNLHIDGSGQVFRVRSLEATCLSPGKWKARIL